MHLARAAYWHEREVIEAFLAKQANHPAVLAAVRWASEYLYSAAVGLSVPAQREIARIEAQGVTGRDLVSEALSVWLYSRTHAKELPDDLRLTYALGNCVLHLAPRTALGKRLDGTTRYRHIGGQVRKDVGQHIRTTLGAFAANVFASLDREHETKQNQVRDLWTPFPVSPSTPEPT